jgi:hypothetical protein
MSSGCSILPPKIPIGENESSRETYNEAGQKVIADVRLGRDDGSLAADDYIGTMTGVANSGQAPGEQA